ncbi:hypothetical protein Q5P01_006932 [Channa striata]|uniref:Metalloendopeptidase n=1 Tax=Channa striata TaxID=64152 RepID=A0AA88N8V6_CHASR|nr:hypothetical protein Q5P01_006932 [Channa striata]
MTPLHFLLLSVTLILSSCQDLKSGGVLSVQNETLDASEIIAKVNANLTNTLIHGDVMPNLKRNADPCTAVGCKWPKTGSYVYVPVEITSDFTAQERDVIINALVSFHLSTCIRFVWRTTHVDYLRFFSGTGCWSYVGRQRNLQPISLQRNGCVYQNTVQHEVMHALGFHHEQVRSDRDSYVNILTQNIQPGMESNFKKVQTNNLGTPYDFNSVMHYPNYAFSKNGLPTITAKSNPKMVLGGAARMSSNDIARINRLYLCYDTLDAFHVIAKANSNITNTLIHGDIMPNLKRNADPCTALGCKWPKTGSYVYVPIAFTIDFTAEERDTIIKALLSFHQSTCIRFVWKSTEPDFLVFYSGNGCWSYLGRQQKLQPISLQKNGCVYMNTVQHEVLHALGLHHEQVRSDRDAYVTVNTQNIQTGMESNFMKVQTNNLGTPYDFNSVMHYPNNAFSKNGQPTITAKSNPDMVLGRATDMSSNDIARVNRLYQCCE